MKKELTKAELNELAYQLYYTQSVLEKILNGIEYSQMTNELQYLQYLQSVMHTVQCIVDDELELMEYNEQ
jgi:hypothetical protein